MRQTKRARIWQGPDTPISPRLDNLTPPRFNSTISYFWEAKTSVAFRVSRMICPLASLSTSSELSLTISIAQTTWTFHEDSDGKNLQRLIFIPQDLVGSKPELCSVNMRELLLKLQWESPGMSLDVCGQWRVNTAELPRKNDQHVKDLIHHGMTSWNSE